MVLRITDDFISSINTHNVRDETINAINVLAKSRQEGKHLIVSSRENIEFLLDSGFLNRNSESVFLRVLSNITQYGSITKHLSHIVHILPYSYEYSYNEGTPNIIHIPIEHFSDTSSVQSTLLLTEDLEDASIYTIIARYYMTKRGIKLQLSSELSHGGGNNTSDQYEYYQSNFDRFVLCIVDSDKNHPTDSLGDTASCILRIDDDDVPFCYFHVLDAHEVENLLPPYFIKEVSVEGSSAYRAAQSLSNLHSRESISYLYLFTDIKDGTTLSDILPFTQDIYKEENDHIDEISNAFETIDNICARNHVCINKGISDCSCLINPSTGGIDLASIANCINNSSFYEINSKIPSTLDKSWSRVGRLIFSWLCSTTPLRA
jgi:hypothetical protein